MITFYRAGNCPACREVENILERLIFEYEVVSVSAGKGTTRPLPEGTRAPVLTYNKDIVQGLENIVAYLNKFEKFKALWEKYQSDACYCDEDEEEDVEF